MELTTLKSEINELRVVQSALCARVRELTAQHDVASTRIQELDCQSRAEARMVQARDQELAAVRHAILNAARIGNNIGRERLQAECEALDSWKRLITTLFQTPLSMAQRGVLSEVVCALDGWRTRRALATDGVHVRSKCLTFATRV